MNECIIMSGIHGSGKTHHAKSLVERFQKTTEGQGSNVIRPCLMSTSSKWHTEMRSNDIVVIAADDYSRYIRCSEEEKKLALHACFIEFMFACQNKARLIIVDNLNLTTEEIAPYYLGAEAYKYKTELITLACGNWDEVECCRKRHHGFPDFSLLADQHVQLRQRKLLPHWTNTVIWTKA